ncbi:MAG: DUF494 family protein [Candidatus Kapaibacterium sp.]|nr:DUF494 family protein [Ignavibacteriota bacterium]MCB9221928.1 DUF494 family protein [Ignavibacteria bacterium]
MNNNLIDILEFVLNSVKEDGELNTAELARVLNKNKSDNLLEKLESNADDLERVRPESKDSFRFLLESEQMFFTKEVQGELIQLQSIGLITGKEIEQLIETAIFREFRLIDKEALRHLLPSIIIQNNVSSNNLILGNNSIN